MSVDATMIPQSTLAALFITMMTLDVRGQVPSSDMSTVSSAEERDATRAWIFVTEAVAFECSPMSSARVMIT